jgi:hypothetical protein
MGYAKFVVGVSFRLLVIAILPKYFRILVVRDFALNQKELSAPAARSGVGAPNSVRGEERSRTL